MEKNTLFVNLFGGPGLGKSTTAAGVFSLLKLHDIDCELVTEYTKDLVWEERHKTVQNQIYVFGKQYHRFWRLKGKVDVVISDSPYLLSIIYNSSYDYHLNATIKSNFNSQNNINVLIQRKKIYNPNGRFQNEDEAKEIDLKIRYLLKDYCHYSMDGDFDIVNKVSKLVLEKHFNKEQKYFISSK